MPGDWGLDQVEISRADKLAGHVEAVRWRYKEQGIGMR
jgi:hypothetical protein